MQIWTKRTLVAIFSLSAVSFCFADFDFPSMPTVEAPQITSSYYTPGTKTEETKAAQKNQTTTEKTESKKASSYDLLNYTDSDPQNVIMEQLLDEVKKLREEQTTIVQVESTVTTGENSNSKNSTNQNIKQQNNVYNSEVPVQKNNARVLRFKVNNYNILSTCKTLFISSQNPDGTFLISGDRIYLSDGNTCSETFYIFFESKKTSYDMSKLYVSTSVSQNPVNENSFLYQISKIDGLVATKTGNFVTLRFTNDDFTIDLLIDLGDQQ